MRILCVFITLLFGMTISATAQGKLEKVEEKLSKKNESTSAAIGYSSRGDSNAENSNYLADSFGGVFISIFAHLTYGLLFETPEEYHHLASKASFTKYPYLRGSKGNFSYEKGDDTTLYKFVVSNRYIAENANLNGNHLNAEFWFAQRISIEADYLQLWETNANFGNNTLAIYQSIAKYQRVRTERFNAWWGIGGSYVDGEVNKIGFTYGLGAELFFTNPISLEADFNQTFINEQNIDMFSSAINYYVNKYKISGGYEYLAIGGQKFNLFSVGIGVTF